MATTDSGRSTTGTTPLMAVVGVADLAVERVRAVAAGAPAVQAQFEAKVSAVQADVEKRVSEFDREAFRAQAQENALKVAGRALEVAGKAEVAYEKLAQRGQSLVDRVRSQSATQDLISQANSTLSRGKAAVTVAVQAADETASALLSTINVGKREATTVVEDTTTEAEVAVKKTETSAKKTATTARKRAAATKSAVKGVQTSAGRTATKATAATKAAAKKVGN